MRPWACSARRAAFGGLVLLALVQCRTPAPPDPDRAPGLARELRAGTQHRDLLDCGRGNCADWFRIYVGSPGTLLLTAEVAMTEARPDAGLELFLGDHRARPIDRTRLRSRGELRQRVAPGYYFVRVGSRTRAPARYLLRSALEPRVVRAPEERPARVMRPKFETVRGRVIEVESRGGNPEGVLFKVERPSRLRIGLRGRLLRDDEVLADVEVIEVYEGGGARARLLAAPRIRIDAVTEIVIDVPAERR